MIFFYPSVLRDTSERPVQISFQIKEARYQFSAPDHQKLLLIGVLHPRRSSRLMSPPPYHLLQVMRPLVQQLGITMVLLWAGGAVSFQAFVVQKQQKPLQFWEGFHLALDKGWLDIVVESDCLNFIKALRSPAPCLQLTGNLVEAIKSLSTNFQSIS